MLYCFYPRAAFGDERWPQERETTTTGDGVLLLCGRRSPDVKPVMRDSLEEV
jgi:hypothetical protein